MLCAAAPRAAPAAPDAALALSGPLTSSPRTQGRSRCGLLCGFAATGVPVHVRGPRGTACQHWRFVCGAAGAGVRRPRAPPPPPERQPAQDGKGPLSSVSSLRPPKLALCMRLLSLPRYRRGARSCCPALTSTPSIRPPHALRRVLPAQLVEQVEAVLDGFNRLPHCRAGKQILGFVISFGPVTPPAFAAA
jgi:hypothetical protein